MDPSPPSVAPSRHSDVLKSEFLDCTLAAPVQSRPHSPAKPGIRLPLVGAQNNALPRAPSRAPFGNLANIQEDTVAFGSKRFAPPISPARRPHSRRQKTRLETSPIKTDARNRNDLWADVEAALIEHGLRAEADDLREVIEFANLERRFGA